MFSTAELERTVNAASEFRDRTLALVSDGWDNERNCKRVSSKVKGVHPRPLKGVYLWWTRMDANGIPDKHRQEFIDSVQFGEFPLTNNGMVFAFLVLECAGRLLNPDGFKRNLSDELLELAGPKLLAMVFRHLADYSFRKNVKNVRIAAKAYGTLGVMASFSMLYLTFEEGNEAEQSVALTYLLKTMSCKLVEPDVRPAKLIPVTNIPETVPCNKVLVPSFIRDNVGVRTPRRPGTMVVFPGIKSGGYTMFAFGGNLQAIEQQVVAMRPELKAAGKLDTKLVFEGFATGWLNDDCLPKTDEH